MVKGKKKWLTALLAALSAAILALQPGGVAPLVPVIESQFEPESALPPVELDPKQCASNWSVCPQTPSVDLHSPPR